MKITKNNVLLTLFIFIVIALINRFGIINSMKRDIKTLSESTRIKTPRSTKLKTIWIKTPDQVLISLPEWQIDQIKALQVFLAHQKGTNNQNNPIDLSVVIKDDGSRVQTNAYTFNLLKTALETSNDIEAFSIFFSSLSKDQQAELIKGAFELEANALTALLGQTKLPSDVQNLINLRLLGSIKGYCIDQLKTKFSFPQNLSIVDFEDDILFNYDVIISPDGQYVLSNHINGFVLLWNIPQKKMISSFKSDINDFNFSPTGNYLIKSTADGYDYYKKNNEFIEFEKLASMNNTSCTTLNPNNEDLCIIQSGDHPHNLRLFSLSNSNTFIKELLGHTGNINTVHFSPDGNYIISSSDGNNNNLILWDGNTYEMIKILDGHKTNVLNADFTPDNQFIISHDDHNDQMIWNTKTHQYVCQWNSPLFYNPSFSHDYTNHKHQNYIGWITQSADLKSAIIENTPKNTYSVNSFLTNCEAIRLVDTGKNLIIHDVKEKNEIIAKYKTSFFINNAIQSTDCTYIAFANTEQYNAAFLIKPLKDTRFYVTLKPEASHTIHFSPHNDYILVTHCKENIRDENDLLIFTIWNIADIEKMNNLFNLNITLSQAQFLYRLYIAQLNNINITIDKNDQDYATYQSLPNDIKKLVNKLLPFKIAQ